MIGIVIVSHSALLAAGVQELATQMVQNAVPLASAAGVDDPEHPLGTDAIAIASAIASVYSDDGVLVLMDLGSAVLSAQMAWEFLTPEQQGNVKLCEAPLVEGTLAAAVQAAAGASLESAIAEARKALNAKASQLSVEPPRSDAPEPEQPPVESLAIAPEIQLTVQNPLGLHARPAAQFVTTCSQFQSQITLQNLTQNTEKVNGKSINQVMALGVRQGEKIALSATGSDAAAALKALQQLVENQFQIEGTGNREQGTANWGSTQPSKHREKRKQDRAAATPPILSGIPVSPGIAIAPLTLVTRTLSLPEPPPAPPQVEWEKLQTALSIAQSELQQIRQKTADIAGEAEAAIFDAHLLYLSDPTWLETLHQQIWEQQNSAATAWQAAIDETLLAYRGLDDSYLRARSADVSDVGQRVLRLLKRGKAPTLELSHPTILVADDFSPSQIVQLDLTKVVGICMVTGGETSHVAILARSLGIPAVVGVGAELLHLETGTAIALNGETGQIWLEPDSAQIQELEALRDERLAAAAALKATAQHPARTRDGHRIHVMANIASVAEAEIARANGAEGVGLLRSEFLYFERQQAPTAAQQEEIYRAIAQTISPNPLTIRTLDLGGDKTLPNLHPTPENNPFLGWRGIRILLDCPELFKTQLSALLQVGYEHPLKLLLPTIASLGEIRAAEQLIVQTQADLEQAEIPCAQTPEIGIMIEVPAAVVLAEQLAAEVDFFSIGTNDLSQYVMAADRTNPRTSARADAFEPAVLRMIQQTVKAAHQAGIPVAVCGELAADVLATPILVGLGVDELSVNPPAIPTIKATLARWTKAEAEAIAYEVLQLDSAEAVKTYVAEQNS